MPAMNATPPAELTPDERRARLDALARREYADLSPDERAEAAALVDAEVLDWKRQLAARLLDDARERRRTKREVADLVGQQEGHVGRMINEPERMSERFVALLSLCVPGYEGAYAEFRRRADRLYLPAGLDLSARDAKLAEVNRALRDQLPTLLEAVEKLKEAARAEAPPDEDSRD